MQLSRLIQRLIVLYDIKLKGCANKIFIKLKDCGRKNICVSPSCLLIPVSCHGESKQTIRIPLIHDTILCVKIERRHQGGGEEEDEVEEEHGGKGHRVT